MEDREVQSSIFEDSYLGPAFEWFSSMKKMGVCLPTMKELLNDQMREIYEVTEKQKFDLKENLVVDHIKKCSSVERNQEALGLLRSLLSEQDMRICDFYMRKGVKEEETLQNNNKQVYYSLYENHIIPASIYIPRAENSIQSVILASTLASTMQNRSQTEFQNICLTGEVVSSFLNFLFAERMAKDVENKNVPIVESVLSFWKFLCHLEYYKEIVSLPQIDSVQYIARVCMLQYVYPSVNGYVEGLKLQQRYREHKKEVLKRIKNVLNRTMTTQELLKKLDTSSISTEEVIQQKVKNLQNYL